MVSDSVACGGKLLVATSEFVALQTKTPVASARSRDYTRQTGAAFSYKIYDTIQEPIEESEAMIAD
ncbi:hypothetical protein GGI07_000611, partial [Coemansia sp. Benny D115]